jgi:hypothetical protein
LKNAIKYRVTKEVLAIAAGLLLVGCRTAPPMQAGWFSVGQDASPLLSSERSELCRTPDGYPLQKIMQETDSILQAVSVWLGEEKPRSAVKLLVYSPDEPMGREILRLKKSRRAAGLFRPDLNSIVLAGDPRDPRFWTVLRHEAAHYSLQRCLRETPPFWLDEGVSCLFESGADENLRPEKSSEREALACHLAKKRGGFNLKNTLSSPHPAYQDGRAYAEAWAVVSYLYRNHRQATAALVHSQTPLAPFPIQYFSDDSSMSSFKAFERQLTEFILKDCNAAR